MLFSTKNQTQAASDNSNIFVGFEPKFNNFIQFVISKLKINHIHRYKSD